MDTTKWRRFLLHVVDDEVVISEVLFINTATFVDVKYEDQIVWSTPKGMSRPIGVVPEDVPTLHADSYFFKSYEMAEAKKGKFKELEANRRRISTSEVVETRPFQLPHYQRTNDYR